jgi:hypothetical protein
MGKSVTAASDLFETPPIDDALIKGSKSLASFASFLGLDSLSLRGSRVWLVYESPAGPCSGISSIDFTVTVHNWENKAVCLRSLCRELKAKLRWPALHGLGETARCFW